MKLGLTSIVLVALAFQILLVESSYAKSKHCVVATNIINGGNFIAQTKDSFLHLRTSWSVLYVLPRSEVTQAKPNGTFYFIESMTSGCNSWTMTFRTEDGSEAFLIGTEAPQTEFVGKKPIEGLNVILEWHPKNYKSHIYPPQELVRFNATWYGLLHGFDTGIPNVTAEQIISKTTLAVCSREVAGFADFEHQDYYRQCIDYYSGKVIVDSLPKHGQ